jgi:cell division protein FtsQ
LHAKPQATERRLNVRRVKRFVLTLTFLMLAAFGVYFLLRSDVFAVRSIDVRGVERTNAAELTAASGVKTGVNIWDVNLSAVTNRICENPWIRTASVTRQLPNSLVIQVTERKPVALVVYRTTFVAVDDAGVGLEIFSSLSGQELPLITGPVVTRVVLGRPVEAPGLIAGIRAVLPLSPDVLRQVSEVNIGADGSLTMTLVTRVSVYLGQPDGSLEKRVALLPSILADVAKQGKSIDYIDLRYEGNPVSGQK